MTSFHGPTLHNGDGLWCRKMFTTRKKILLRWGTVNLRKPVQPHSTNTAKAAPTLHASVRLMSRHLLQRRLHDSSLATIYTAGIRGWLVSANGTTARYGRADGPPNPRCRWNTYHHISQPSPYSTSEVRPMPLHKFNYCYYCYFLFFLPLDVDSPGLKAK